MNNKSHVTNKDFQVLHVIVQKALSQYEMEMMAPNISMVERVAIEIPAMVYELVAQVVGNRTETDVRYIRYPETWLDAFKQRWFSPRMLRRWPVKFHEERIVVTTLTLCCPHLPIAPQAQHVRFLMYENSGRENDVRKD